MNVPTCQRLNVLTFQRLLCLSAAILLFPSIPARAVSSDSGTDEGAIAQEVERHNNRGALLAAQGRFREAAEAFHQAVRLAPDFAVGHYNLGLARMRLKVYSEAAEAFESAARVQPDYGDAWYQLGVARQAGGQFEASARAYRSALPFRPDGAELRYRLGFVSWKLGDWETAVAQWETFRTRYAGHSLASRVMADLPRAYYNLGTAHQAAGRSVDAIAAYRQALSLSPDYVDAYHNLAVIYREQGQFSRAVATLREALSRRPEDPATLTRLGGLYAEQDSLAQAQTLYRSTLRADSTYVEARYDMVRLYLRQGKATAAQQSALVILADNPNDPDRHALLAYVYEHNAQGERYGKGYRATDAIRAYETAARMAPDDAGLYYNMGVIHGRQGHWTQALSAFHAALAIDSTHAEVRRWLPLVEENLEKQNTEYRRQETGGKR